jgi:hypothetical protein
MGYALTTSGARTLCFSFYHSKIWRPKSNTYDKYPAFWKSEICHISFRLSLAVGFRLAYVLCTLARLKVMAEIVGKDRQRDPSARLTLIFSSLL